MNLLKQNSTTLDITDLKILDWLQKDASLSNQELAEKVFVSPPTCLRRVKRLKDLGFIPVKAGFKAFVWEDQFYVLGEVGAGFAVTNDYNQNTLILSPGIGYANKYFDASIRYEYYNDLPTFKISIPHQLSRW